MTAAKAGSLSSKKRITSGFPARVAKVREEKPFFHD
jgi:hypothetical protein